MPFVLPNLPYDYAVFEPVIDKETMTIHHTKHHQAYVDKLNAALADQPDLANKTIEELLANLAVLPEAIRRAVQNNGGGHFNHSLFWQIMNPPVIGNGLKPFPIGDLAGAITSAFGDFTKFQEAFTQAATTCFGSGWAWLALKNGALAVYSTTNQDNPLMQGDKAILGLDVWEHAYYLKYQNRRPDYIAAWWSVVNWAKANDIYLSAKQN